MWSEPWPFDKDEDVCLLYSRCTLVEFCAFLISLHWSSKVSDLGLGGASYLEILILCETWAVERLVIEQAAIPRPSRRVCALFLCVGCSIWSRYRNMAQLQVFRSHVQGLHPYKLGEWPWSCFATC